MKEYEGVCVCGGASRVTGNTIEARNWEPEAVRVSSRVARGGWRAQVRAGQRLVSLRACLPCQDPTTLHWPEKHFSLGDVRPGFESQRSTNWLVGQVPSSPLLPGHKEVSTGILGQWFSARGDSVPQGVSSNV